MERHTFTINFSASPSKCRKNGLMPIYATITQNGERATFTTGMYIHPSDWTSDITRNQTDIAMKDILNKKSPSFLKVTMLH